MLVFATKIEVRKLGVHPAKETPEGAADALHARHLQHLLLLTAQPVDPGFDYLAQTLRLLQTEDLHHRVGCRTTA